ncbi:MAG TPA: aminoacyl-histidine dipeptidase [Longimicrobiales bacterium]|nr:aminoacyl-histidine dipeptidase [Longimicrobiales bacterium]
MTFVANLEPNEVWKHFDRILTIPRGSKNEAAMRSYVVEIAEQNGLTHRTDAAGNVVVSKPGSKGREKAPTVILQSHLDMVNENNADVTHDWTRDPIVPRQDGDYLTATGTTLGSDNGIGVAAMLALMETGSVQHGPLEFLFTIDEETGLTGASDLDASLIGGRILLNLDSEEEYTVTVGCAGGAGMYFGVPLRKEIARGDALKVTLRGLHGGHSGIDIHLQRGNAIKLLARMLNAVRTQTDFHLASFAGGNMHNAIPREASATVVTWDEKTLREALQKEFAAVKDEFTVADKDMQIEIATAELKEAWSADTTSLVINVIEALPHGVLAMSMDIPGLVETSTNVATVAEKDGQLEIGTSTRSSVMPALRAAHRRLRAIGELAGVQVDERAGYPGWKPDMSSKVLQVVKTVHQEVQGREPEIVAVHAGLECGIIGEKVAGMDMVSFGPQIEHPHSPQERVQVESVGRFYRLLVATLERLAS